MSKKKLDVKFYNGETGEFERCNIGTEAEAVLLSDGKTVEEKIEDLSNKSEKSFIVISEDMPEDPTDGLLWMQIVTS